MVDPTAHPPTTSPRVARQGLFGGPVSSRQRRNKEGGASGSEAQKEKKKSVSTRTMLSDAFELVEARKGRLAVGLLLMAANRLSGLVLPGTTKFLLDRVIGQGDRALLGKLILLSGGATLVQAITSFALALVLGRAAQRSITEMRRNLQRHVGRLPVSYFDQTRAGALLSRVMNDAEGIRNLVGTGLVEVVGGLVTALLVLGILFYLNVKLTLIALGVMSLFTLAMKYAFTTLRPLFRERSKINAELSGRLAESFSGVRVVKAYRAERREALVFTKRAHLLFRNVAATITGFAGLGAFSTILLGAIGVAIMAVGSRDVLAGRMTVGEFFSFTLYLGMMVGPVVQIVNIGSQITEAFAGLERIRELRNEATEDEGDEARCSLPRVEGRLEFRDVHFEYKKDVPVLRGVSFEAHPGSVTALVGPSGSGKSTIIGLVASFYRATAGQILIDGQDLAEIKLADYRAHLAVVFQDNFLFDGTVRENIAFSRPEASEEEIARAARIARCDDFVARLPEGFDTVVGERGVKLSGGERQRVAIARAILSDPRILILDEATSSLDSESEAYIQEGLAELMKGRTTFVIAHRLSTIRQADTILVVEDGKIVERGRHQELLALGGRYHALYTRQYNLESNLFRNPGERDEEAKPAATAAKAADATVGRLPLIPV